MMHSGLFPAKTDNDEVLARRLVDENFIDTRNFGSVYCGADIWSSGPQQDRSWRWTLHAFLPLDPLIATGRIGMLSQLIGTWRSKFESEAIEQDFPWHDHATALRLDRLSRIKLQFPQCDFMDLAQRHAELLMRDDFYSKHTNHGFDQALSLILAALAFPEAEAAGAWRELGLARLNAEIHFAFTDEGVHVENSPAYHFGMISNMLRARRLLKASGQYSADFDEHFDKALRFLIWVTRPDRFLAYMGDSTSYRPSVHPELVDLPSVPLVEWVSTGGRVGTEPTGNFAVYEESGYAAYRSSWKSWPGHTHIVMKSGFLSPYHRQDDDLNVLVHAYGEDWLIDSGLYNHNRLDPVRIYMRSARAHNVPFVAGAKIDRSSVGKNFATLKRMEAPGFPYAVKAETRMYQPGSVTRELLIENQDHFLIRDVFSGYEQMPRYWIFHVPKDKSVTLNDGAVLVSGKKKTMVITPSDSELSVSLYLGFKQPFPSVTSTAINKTSDSRAIVFGPFASEAMQFDFQFI
ncbi:MULTISPECIES: heparinase II/III family protein [Alcaligenes]|uniref:heparinase II/III family protein n=1 Tax=Alcaligenes TaxID=507 RepID=UPI00122CBC78|nr:MULTISPECIES: heparinase II/III family protein [Alcaligenes]KAA1286176.1 hypothetical protein D7S43_11400 [Alcaligenes faecalis]MDT0217839.1 heparinase II/III family protein [Alcaligenes sp. AB3]